MSANDRRKPFRHVFNININLLVAISLLIAGLIIVLGGDDLPGSPGHAVSWTLILAWNAMLLGRASHYYRLRKSPHSM